MSFFEKKETPAPPPHQPVFTPPKTGGMRGDRSLAVRIDAPDAPEHRRPGETLEGRGKVGLTNNVVLERLPRGCLFKVSGGWFDLDGYWCVMKADRQAEVRRGSPKKILRLLTEAQKKELARVRLNARRHGTR